MYSENEMWKYSGISSEAASYNALNTGFEYVLEAATDIMVNGLGYTESQVKKYYSNLGLATTSATIDHFLHSGISKHACAIWCRSGFLYRIQR
jgi:hypothetical protein